MLKESSFISIIPTTNPGRAKDYYCNTLGLEIVADDGFALVFRSGERLIRVTEVPGLEPQSFSIIAWQVDDIDAAVRDLTSRGVEFERYDGMKQDDLGIWTVPGRDARVAWFKDPDRNVLSVVQSS